MEKVRAEYDYVRKKCEEFAEEVGVANKLLIKLSAILEAMGSLSNELEDEINEVRLNH